MSASMKAMMSPSASMTPRRTAAPLPLFCGNRISRAALCWTISSVRSVDPSLMTMISNGRKCSATSAIVLPMTDSSLNAGMMMEVLCVEVLMHERPSARRLIAELYERQKTLPQLVGFGFLRSELDARDDLSRPNLVACSAIEHDAGGVVDDVIGLLAAGAEVDGEHAGLVRVDEGDVAAARRFHFGRLARLGKPGRIAALRRDPFFGLLQSVAGPECIVERRARRFVAVASRHHQHPLGLRG